MFSIQEQCCIYFIGYGDRFKSNVLGHFSSVYASFEIQFKCVPLFFFSGQIGCIIYKYFKNKYEFWS